MKKIVVDANILCVLVAGFSVPEAIGRHKRLRAYEKSDYKKLMTLLEPFDQLITCAHILTETSNLLANTNDVEKMKLLEGLRLLLIDMEEVHIDSKVACNHYCYHRLGLTDAVLLSMSLSESSLLTADLDLTIAAQNEKREVFNYNWYRDTLN